MHSNSPLSSSILKRVLFLIIFLTVSAGPAVSQEPDRITIVEPEITVKQAFTRIEQQTGYAFGYNRTRFDGDRKVSLSLRDAAISTVMSEILKGSGYTYSLRGNHILIYEGEPVAWQPEAGTSVPAGQAADTVSVAAGAEELGMPGESGITEDPVTEEAQIAGQREELTAGLSFGELLPPAVVINTPESVYEPSVKDYGCKGPFVAVKTNVLYWATTTPNLGVELSLGRRTTFNITGSYNPWVFGQKAKNRKIKHFIIQPELRLWECEKFEGGYWGLHALYGQYNVGGVDLPLGIFQNLKDHRYHGWAAGAGVSYGRQWYLSPHWNLEATFGFGYSYLQYKKFECIECGDFIGRGYKHYFGPTKIGISMVYLFKSRK